MKVDPFHFNNHVDPWCHKNMDPNGVESLKDINSQICEQSFRFLNKYTNVKCMNNVHFTHYFIFIIDIHNLHLTKQIFKLRPGYVPPPLSPIPTQGIELDNAIDTALKDIESKMDKIVVTSGNSCDKCSFKAQSKKGLTQHMTQKHTKIKTDFNCMYCKKSFSSQSSLNRHVKSCKEKK